MAKIIVPRTAYIRQLDSYRSDTDLLKIVTGIRRCGKSELLRQFRQHLIDDGVPEPEIIYIDLERSRYAIDSERMLYETIRNAVHGEGCYIMIDEVHFVRGWERVVSTVKNEFRANMYLTGSNSNMLSDDLATHVTGRYATIHVMPFSFREFVTRYPIDSENGYTQRLYQYMRWGGMPIIDLDDDGTKNRAILRGGVRFHSEQRHPSEGRTGSGHTGEHNRLHALEHGKHHFGQQDNRRSIRGG